MKSLNSFVTEALIKKTSKYATAVKPKDTDELKQIIKDTIEKEGDDCDLCFIDVSEITDMSFLFYRSDFNGDISEWNVSNVTNMEHMFEWSEFNGDISNWDVSNVTKMEHMFAYSKFDGDISKWDVSDLQNNTYIMFKGCPAHDKYQHIGTTGTFPKIENGHFVKIK